MRRCAWLWPLVLLAQGCMVSSEDSLQAQTSNTYSLATVGDMQVVFETPLVINLKVTAPAGVHTTYTTDGSLGPDADPYAVSANPAVFDQSNGVFSWTPASGQRGKYSVQFTVTSDESPARSASESVSITVWSEGEGLYTENCAQCHGADGLGSPAGTPKNIQGVPATLIRVKINDVSQMSKLKSLTDAQLQSIAGYLATLVP